MDKGIDCKGQPIVVYNGIRFSVTPNGYYAGSKNYERFLLHRYVYKTLCGDIPKGYVIHHKDHNRGNNLLSNLELVRQKDHAHLHFGERIEQIISSAVGNRKRKNQIPQDEVKRRMNDHLCLWCGCQLASEGEYYCSSHCKEKFKRHNGLRDVEKVCVICGKKFLSNRLDYARTCSPQCHATLTARTFRENVATGKSNPKRCKQTEKVCIECGKTFLGKSIAMFCSKACKQKHARKTGRYLIEKTCIVCGKQFKTDKHRQGDTCSKYCAGLVSWQTKLANGSRIN